MAKRTTIYCNDETESKLDELMRLAEARPAYWSSLTGKGAPRNLNQLITALVELGHDRLVEDEDTDPLIDFNSQGVPIIAEKNFKIRQIAADYRMISQDAGEIQRQHPNLSMREVQAGLDYYLAHKQEVDDDLEKGVQEAKEIQAQMGPSPLRERIRQIGNQM